MSKQPSAEHIISLFNQLFLESENTELVKGEDEPIYLPASSEYLKHRIVFAHGFVASALHEIAHWCVAGVERRLLEDYGYWYKPDGRTAQEQEEFERYEVLPQALEWIMTQSCGMKFNFSADNLNTNLGAGTDFKNNVLLKVQLLLQEGLPARHQLLVDSMQLKFKTEKLDITQFSL